MKKYRISTKLKGYTAVIVIAILYIIGFFFFLHTDLLGTAQRSLEFLKGHCLDFYSRVYKISGSYSANYLPSTFVLFAIWNIPLKLLNCLPTVWGDWNDVFIFWNKLLPCLAFVISSFVIYKIIIENFDNGEQTAKIGRVMFLLSPVAFLSQILFGQYDSFTVLFVLLGVYYYFNDKRKKNFYLFILFFAIAFTFKYFSVCIFVVLLLLKNKSVPKIIISTIAVFIPALVEGSLFYIFDRQAFVESVFNFNALGYSEGAGGISVGFASINLLATGMLILCIYAYLKKVENKEEWFQYAIFLCCGVCFVLFSFMTWHPQWLLLAVPFWTLSFCMHNTEQTKALLWIDIAFELILCLFVAKVFVYNVDQNLLKNGLLDAILFYKPMEGSRTMTSLYYYGNVNMLFSILVSVFAAYFGFSHPRYCGKLLGEKIYSMVKGRFIAFALFFMIPAFACVPSMASMYDVIWDYKHPDEQQYIIEVNEDTTVIQNVNIEFLSNLEVVEITIGTYKDTLNEAELSLSVKDISENTLLGESVYTGVINDCDKICFYFSEIELIPKHNYEIRLINKSDKKIAVFADLFVEGKEMNVHILERNYSNEELVVDNIVDNSRLDMTLYGKAKK